MRNVFVSYAHRLDQADADAFRSKFGSGNMVFSDRSLSDDIGYLSDETIKNNYIRPKIRNSSVTIVLIGAETDNRWWIDWEIYYSLLHTAGNDRNGVLGILLPGKSHSIPKRILDNKDICPIVDMPQYSFQLEDYIEQAYKNRIYNPDLSRPLRQRNS